MVNRRYILALFFILMMSLASFIPAFAQSLNRERKALCDFLVRMYNNNPFEGVRVVTDYDSSYLVVAISLDQTKYNSLSAISRVAEVKAMNEVSRYFNGSTISSDIIIRTSENSNGEYDTTIIENLRERSMGYVKQLEHLTSFNGTNSRTVFLFLKELEM